MSSRSFGVLPVENTESFPPSIHENWARSRQFHQQEYWPLPSEESALIDLRPFLRMIWKYKWLMIALPLFLVVIAAVKDLMATPLYTARATILVKYKPPQLYDYASFDSGGATNSASTWDIYPETESRLLVARSLAAKVIATEGLDADPAFTGGGVKRSEAVDVDSRTIGAAAQATVPNWLVDRYLDGLEVRLPEDSELATVSFTSANPELSARIANAHVREFIRQGVDLNSQTSDEAARFLEKELGEIKRRLEQSELALNNYRRDMGIIPGLISLNGNQDVVLERLNKLGDRVQQLHLENINLESKLDLIKQGHAEALPAVIDSKLVQTLKENLDGLLAQDAVMSSRYKPSYPPLADLNAKIGRTRDAINHEIGDVVADLKSQYAASLKNEQALDAELAQQKDIALHLNDAAVKYLILQRDADTNKELYNAVLKRMKDVEVAADLHASNVSIVDPATAPRSPSSPQEMRDLLVAAVLGLMAAFGITVLLEVHDDSFKSAEELESCLMVPQLGMIPDFHGWNRNLDQLEISRAGELPQTRKRSLLQYGYYGAQSSVGEAFRILRTALLLSRAGAPPRTSLITSASPHEGKTTVSVNLAVALAATGKRVLLIDADLRRPRCHELLRMENHLGLTEILSGMRDFEELIRPAEFPNLFLLSSGEIPPNPSELLGSERMREGLSLLAQDYDHILIDSPPIIAVTDAVVLSPAVDGVILVTGRQTPRQQVKAAVSRLRYARAKVLGIVLNMVGPMDYSYKTRYRDYGYGGYKQRRNQPSDAVIGK
jgi:succinoglycan biosynthesis transport protein ExoP